MKIKAPDTFINIDSDKTDQTREGFLKQDLQVHMFPDRLCMRVGQKKVEMKERSEN